MKRVTVALAVWLALGGGVAAQTSPSARETLAGLETLHQAVTRGLDYAEYRRRLAETKATFDRYAVRSSATVAEAEVKASLSAAMNDHRFAEALWAERLRHDGELPRASFERLGVLLDHFPCPALRAFVESVTGRSGDARTIEAASADRAVRLLWSCAADKIAEAERRLAPPVR